MTERDIDIAIQVGLRTEVALFLLGEDKLAYGVQDTVDLLIGLREAA